MLCEPGTVAGPPGGPLWHPPGVELSLRATTEHDLAAVVALEADPDVAPWISPWTLERHLRALADPDLAHLSFETAQGGAFAGFVLLGGLRDPAGSVELRRIALCGRGRGLGKPALGLALSHAFRSCAARRVWLDMLPANGRAAAVYARSGFQDDGIVPDAHPLPDGSLGPLRFMSISRGRWERGVTRSPVS